MYCTIILVQVCLTALPGGLLAGSRAWQNCKNGKAANCYANFTLMGMMEFDLRGGGDAFRLDDSPAESSYLWFGNSLYQNHPVLGRVFVTLSEVEGRESFGTVTSHAPTGVPFFPADVVNDLYLELSLPDVPGGMNCYTVDPLHLTATISNFFEEDVVFTLEQDVTIYMIAEPEDVPVGEFLAGSLVTAFPARDISVEQSEYTVEGSNISAVWAVETIAGDCDVFWSVNATDGVDILSDASGFASLSPGVPMEIEVHASATDWSPPAEIVLNVSRISGPLSYGVGVVQALPAAPALVQLGITESASPVEFPVVGGDVYVMTHCSFQDPAQPSNPDLGGWVTYDLSAARVGNFAQAWAHLGDIDPCWGNNTPMLGFIDDGIVVPGVGPSTSTLWNYGPGGYVVNSTGGLAGPSGFLHNEAWSPPIEWPSGDYSSATLCFDVYCHEELTAEFGGIYPVWHVRSTADPAGTSGWTEWRDEGCIYYGGPGYFHIEKELTGLLEPGCTYIQLAVGVQELGYRWGISGNEATPGPYFDNVYCYAHESSGPHISMQEFDSPRDAFPTIGYLDEDDLAANNVPLLAADDSHGYAVVATVKARRAGLVLVGAPRLNYVLFPEPTFDPVRTSGLPNEGYIDGEDLGEDRWGFMLPQSGFFYPGDIFHFYLEAQDDDDGDIGTSTLPADTTGFSDPSFLPWDPTNMIGRYPALFVARALPSVSETKALDGPPILIWNEIGLALGADEWGMALQNLGYVLGEDYDLFYSKTDFASGYSGFADVATLSLLSEYSTILHAYGDAGSLLVPEADAQLLDDWLSSGNRNLLLMGDNLASSLQMSGPVAQGLLAGWLSVGLVTSDLSPVVGGQSSIGVVPLDGNTVFNSTDEWVAAGSCPYPRTFDGVEVVGNAERLAEFTDESGLPGSYTLAAAVLHHDIGTGSRVIYYPTALASIWSSGGADKELAPLAARVQMLNEILLYFGHTGSGGTTSTPVPAHFEVGCYPNPFNPDITIKYHMPRQGHLCIRIYNVQGEHICTLVDKDEQAGLGSVRWAGKTDQGRPVGSGVYFYRAQYGGEEIVGKVTLVK